MAHVFAMPMLGQTMEEGTVVQWFKQEGDPVRQGEALVEVMSDKASFEVESPADGLIRKLLVAANDAVPIHTPIAIIGDADESIDGLVPASGVSAPAAVHAAPATSPAAPAAAVAASRAPSGPVAISPRARRLADERGIPISALAGRGTGPGGRVIERDVTAALEQATAATDGGHLRVTPLAAKIAEELGVDPSAARMPAGSRVTAVDVRRAADATRSPVGEAAAQPAAAQTVEAGEPAVADRIPFRGMRKMVADTVARSRQTAPHVCVNMEADMTELVALHARLQPEVMKAHNTKLTYTDLLIKAVARALKDHPMCNAALIGDEIRLYAERNVGVAVAGDGALVVPVIRNADEKALNVISAELKALAERARAGKSTSEDLAGGTFTITNLGIFGVDSFDPILVPPQACILGVCRIAEKPIVVDKQVAIRSMMNLCLSFDHRVIDGVPAARFLQRLKELLESPLLILL